MSLPHSKVRKILDTTKINLSALVSIIFLSTIIISCAMHTRTHKALYHLNVGEHRTALDLIATELNHPLNTSPDALCDLHVATIKIIGNTATHDIAPPDPDHVVKRSYNYICRNCQSFKKKIVMTENLCGQYFLNTGRPGLAIPYLKRSIELSQNDPYTSMCSESNLACCYGAMGKFDLMDHHRIKAIKIGSEYFGKKRKYKYKSDELSEWNAYKNILESRMLDLSWTQNPENSSQEMHQLWSRIENINKKHISKRQQYLTYRNASLVFAAAGDTVTARKLFNRAKGLFLVKHADALQLLKYVQSRFSFRSRGKVNLDLKVTEAKILEAEGKISEAALLWEDFIETFQEKGEKALSGYDYQMAGLAQEASGNYDRAIEYLEKSVFEFENVRSSFELKFRSMVFRGRRTFSYWGLLRSYAARHLDQKREKDFKGALKTARMLRARQFGELLGMKAKIEADLEALKSKLEPDELVLNLFVTDRAIVIFSISSTNHELHLIQCNISDFNAIAGRTKSRLSTPGDMDGTIADIQDVSDIILSPIKDRLNKFKRLVIIPDGILNGIPLTILSKSSEHYVPLIMEHEVLFTPSISYLITQRDSEYQFEAGKLLAVADPYYGSRAVPEIYRDDSITFYKRAVESFNLFSPLPETRLEVENVSRFFRPDEVEFLLGNEASEAAIAAANLQQFRYLHFATHGILGNQIPGIFEPALVLATEPKDSSKDGFLTLSEVEKLKLNCELAVLSACDTGSGEYYTGEGVIGLSRGFLIAGSRSVLVSLWPVNSVTTVDLMTSFYWNFRSGKSKAESLRLAQLALLSGKQTIDLGDRGIKVTDSSVYNTLLVHPHHWAPFILIGK